MMRNPVNMFEFVSVGELAETTIQLLSLNLRSPQKAKGRLTPQKKKSTSSIEQVEQLIFQQARDYLGKVREGFVLSVRSADIPDRYQLRYLIDRVIIDWDKLSNELGLASDNDSGTASSNSSSSTNKAETSIGETDIDESLEPVRQQLLAFGMAAVALGTLPKLPSEQVTFPHSYGNPPTYSDISAPHTPAEMLIRIEELEEMVWQMMSSDPGQLVQDKYGPVRRTYGFFETSAWLARQESERFGIQKKTTTPLTFF